MTTAQAKLEHGEQPLVVDRLNTTLPKSLNVVISRLDHILHSVLELAITLGHLLNDDARAARYILVTRRSDEEGLTES